MAQSQAAAVNPEIASQELSAAEQAEFDAMRDDAPASPPPPPAVIPETPATRTAPANDPSPGIVEPTIEGAEVGDKQNTIPVPVLQEERRARQAAEARVTELEKAQAVLTERTNILLQNLAPKNDNQQQPTVQELPDPRVDPVGYILGALEQQGKTLQALTQNGQQTEQQRRDTAIITEITQRAQLAEKEFSATTPDYNNAITKLVEFRHKELTQLGWRDPVQREQQIRREGLEIAAGALGDNRNPAQVLYELALMRGYQKPAADPGADPAVPATAAQNTAHLATVAAGQRQAGGSLSGARGAGPIPLTAEALMRMSESEFDAAMKTREGRELMG